MAASGDVGNPWESPGGVEGVFWAEGFHHSNGLNPGSFLLGKSQINGTFSITMFDYQRINQKDITGLPHYNLWFIRGIIPKITLFQVSKCD